MPEPRASNKFFRKINRFSFGFIEGKKSISMKSPIQHIMIMRCFKLFFFFRSGIDILKMDARDIKR